MLSSKPQEKQKVNPYKVTGLFCQGIFSQPANIYKVQEVTQVMLILGATNISLLNNISQQLHSLIPNKRILNLGTELKDAQSASIFVLA